jgi:hypothetical protein
VGQYTQDAWSLAKRTAAGLNEIRKLINVETKFLDKSNALSAGSTPTLIACSLVSQGLTSASRVGDSIKIQHIHMTCIAYSNDSSSGTVIRVTLFRDLEGQATFPTAALVYENTSTVSNILACPPKFNETNRFSILYDDVCYISNTGKYSNVMVFDEARGGHIKYLAEDTSESSVGNGHIYAFITSLDNTNKASVQFYSRVLFTDD